MNEQKQKIISDICPFYKEYGTCEQCNKDLDVDDEPCYFECMANVIINNNYVKQSEGEWMNDGWGSFKCSVCDGSALKNGYEQPVKSKFCPRCGAKMRCE